MLKYSMLPVLLVAIALTAPAEELFVNFKTGNDANTGTKVQPLRTIGEAARRVNRNGEHGTDTILLSAGVHLLTDPDVLPILVAIIGNGHRLVVDHCVFFHCENAVVFGNAEGGSSHRNAMQYCLVYGAHYGGLWTTANTGYTTASSPAMPT